MPFSVLNTFCISQNIILYKFKYTLSKKLFWKLFHTVIMPAAILSSKFTSIQKEQIWLPKYMDDH